MSLFLRRVPFAAAILFLVLCFGVDSRSQSLPGYQPPDKGKPATELSNRQKAAQGKAPLAKLYGDLKPNTAKIKLLPALTQKEKKRKTEKQFQVGVTRSLPNELNPLTDSALYSVAEGDVRVSEVVSTGALSMRLHFKSMHQGTVHAGCCWNHRASSGPLLAARNAESPCDRASLLKLLGKNSPQNCLHQPKVSVN